MKKVPILMYHRVDSVSYNRNTVLLDNFIKQLTFLQNAGYTTIGMSDLHKHMTTGAVLPPKPVLLTFDDGYEDNYRCVLPLLLQYEMKAIVFPVAKWIGQPCGWKQRPSLEERLMTWGQLRQWQDSGMEIGSHTLSHVRLSTLDQKQIESELQESKQALEQNLSQPIEFLCYPYGDLDDRVKEQAQRLGYKAALAIFHRTSLWSNDLYALQRIGISSRTSLREFQLKVSPIHQGFIGLRILEKKIRDLKAKW